MCTDAHTHLGNRIKESEQAQSYIITGYTGTIMLQTRKHTRVRIKASKHSDDIFTHDKTLINSFRKREFKGVIV